jgi:hypothetical protein
LSFAGALAIFADLSLVICRAASICDGFAATGSSSVRSPRRNAATILQIQDTHRWFLEGRFGEVYTDKPGHPPLPTRLMAGLVIIKHMHNLSDEVLCERWVENPYYQYFCGEEFFQHQPAFDRSSLTRWRQRMRGAAASAAAGEPGGGHADRGDEGGCQKECVILSRFL